MTYAAYASRLTGFPNGEAHFGGVNGDVNGMAWTAGPIRPISRANLDLTPAGVYSSAECGRTHAPQDRGLPAHKSSNTCEKVTMNQEMYADNPYARFGMSVVNAPADARVSFIRKTYLHLALAIYAFVALEWFLFSLGFDQWMLQTMGQFRWAPLIVFGLFIAVSWIADSWARSTTSLGIQYVGLLLYVLAQAVIFVPILAMAQSQSVNIAGSDLGVIPAAAVTTLVMFAGLTAVAFLTKKDFSFLGGFLTLAAFAAFALILVSYFVGFNLGVWFSAAVIILACGYILYDTSNIMYHYRTDQYVAASLALFASVALLFMYLLRLFMSRD
jgi:FtsH-binding integral membrane protein